MVASQQEDHVGIFDFVCQQQTHCLNTLFTSIDEVTDKEEFVLWRTSSGDFKQPEHVVKLPVEISGNSDRPFELDQGRLLFEDFLRLLDNPSDCFLIKVDVGANLHVLGLHQLKQYHVEGEFSGSR